MKIKQFADYLGVSRQYVDAMTKKHNIKVGKPHGVGWLTKPQMKTLEGIIGRKKNV